MVPSAFEEAYRERNDFRDHGSSPVRARSPARGRRAHRVRRQAIGLAQEPRAFWMTDRSSTAVGAVDGSNRAIAEPPRKGKDSAVR